MQGRSWMAALTITAILSAAVVMAGDGDVEGDKAATPPSPKTDARDKTTTKALATSPSSGVSKVQAKPTKTPANANAHIIRLDLKIAGLTSKGCDVEIKPAHGGCKFQTRKEHVHSNGMLVVELDDVEILNADRDCTFAITIREAGQTEKTWRRGLRVNATNTVAQTLPCYLNSPSKLARAIEADAKTKR